MLGRHACMCVHWGRGLIKRPAPPKTNQAFNNAGILRAPAAQKRAGPACLPVVGRQRHNPVVGVVNHHLVRALSRMGAGAGAGSAISMVRCRCKSIIFIGIRVIWSDQSMRAQHYHCCGLIWVQVIEQSAHEQHTRLCCLRGHQRMQPRIPSRHQNWLPHKHRNTNLKRIPQAFLYNGAAQGLLSCGPQTASR